MVDFRQHLAVEGRTDALGLLGTPQGGEERSKGDADSIHLLILKGLIRSGSTETSVVK
jgi:hypothetical protein